MNEYSGWNSNFLFKLLICNLNPCFLGLSALRDVGVCCEKSIQTRNKKILFICLKYWSSLNIIKTNYQKKYLLKTGILYPIALCLKG